MPEDRLYPEPIHGRGAELLVAYHRTKRSLLRAPLTIVMLVLLVALVVVGVFMLSRVTCDTQPSRNSGHVLPHSRSTQFHDLPR